MAQKPNKNINERKVIEEFATRRTSISKLAVFVGIIAAATVLLFYAGFVSKAIAGILLAAATISAIFVNMKLWRCPSCNGHLGKLYLGLKEPKHCPNCGIRLVEQ